MENSEATVRTELSPKKKPFKKKIVPIDKQSTRTTSTKIYNHPLRERSLNAGGIREVNSCICPNKPLPLSAKKNYTLQIEKKIKETSEKKMKPIKNTSELPPEAQNTLEEKITKHMNFPVDKKLYKKLISLKLTEKPPAYSVPVAYEPAVRDREPRLEDYCTPKYGKEQPIPVPISFPQHYSCRTFNGYRTYQLLKSWAS